MIFKGILESFSLDWVHIWHNFWQISIPMKYHISLKIFACTVFRDKITKPVVFVILYLTGLVASNTIPIQYYNSLVCRTNRKQTYLRFQLIHFSWFWSCMIYSLLSQQRRLTSSLTHYFHPYCAINQRPHKL